MENGEISDGQLSASGESKDKPATFGRLNRNEAWRADQSPSNFELWYQVDFLKRAKIMGIKTQGKGSYYVKKFKISYSNNGIDFQEYEDVMGTKV